MLKATQLVAQFIKKGPFHKFPKRNPCPEQVKGGGSGWGCLDPADSGGIDPPAHDLLSWLLGPDSHQEFLTPRLREVGSWDIIVPHSREKAQLARCVERKQACGGETERFRHASC